MIIDIAHFVLTEYATHPIVKLDSIDRNSIMANYSDEFVFGDGLNMNMLRLLYRIYE